MLLRTVKARAEKLSPSGNKASVREYLIVDLGLSTGLRVGEVANLKCGDLFIENNKSSLVVRQGKGDKFRSVSFHEAFKEHLIQYLRWKEEIGESICSDAPLLVSSRTNGHLTVRAIQRAFKRCLEYAGLSLHYSMHSLRHTYACHLYKASKWNLRAVQKQLGHSRIITTQVYADVMVPDLKNALEKLYA